METTEIFKHATDRLVVAPGSVVFSQGDPADVMYAVIEGELEVEVNEKVVALLGPGQVVGRWP